MRQRREQLGLSREEVAGRAHLPQRFLVHVEEEEDEIAVAALLELAVALGMTLDQLLVDPAGPQRHSSELSEQGPSALAVRTAPEQHGLPSFARPETR